MEREKLRALYDRVFDANGAVKLCHREACEQLIKATGSITSKYVGNPNTGIMNLDVLKEEYAKYMLRN